MDDIQWDGILDEAVKVLFPDEKKSRRKYTPDQVRNLFILVFGKKQQVKVASNACEINASTAAGYVNQVRPVFTKYAGLGKEVDKTSQITKLFSLNKSVPTAAATRKVEVPKRNQKIFLLHSQFLAQFFESNEFARLKDAKEALKEFDNVDVSEQGIHKHMKTKCCLVVRSLEPLLFEEPGTRPVDKQLKEKSVGGRTLVLGDFDLYSDKKIQAIAEARGFVVEFSATFKFKYIWWKFTTEIYRGELDESDKLIPRMMEAAKKISRKDCQICYDGNAGKS
ncbi:hypothetical protein [Parasitella parasitica]|uniref:Uncharacterized protein n=1 Tax=Parasitella parasitica TaxID=35722 RepID=A0A0B7NQ21_9FUNG|nr:hypothetical protein [Parasitella parasitica]